MSKEEFVTLEVEIEQGDNAISRSVSIPRATLLSFLGLEVLKDPELKNFVEYAPAAKMTVYRGSGNAPFVYRLSQHWELIER